MRIDSEQSTDVRGIVLQDRIGYADFSTEITIETSQDGIQWEPVDNGHVFPTGILVYTDSNYEENHHYNMIFSKPVRTRYVQITTKAWAGHICMRAGLLVLDDG
jgi:hypothetical protein